MLPLAILLRSDKYCCPALSGVVLPAGSDTPPASLFGMPVLRVCVAQLPQ